MSDKRKRTRQPITCSRCNQAAPSPDHPEREYWIRLDIHGAEACHAGNTLCGPCTWSFLIFLDYAPNRRHTGFVAAQQERYQQRYGGSPPAKLGTADTTVH